MGLAYPNVLLYNQSGTDGPELNGMEMKKIDLLIVIGSSMRQELNGIHNLVSVLVHDGLGRFKRKKPRSFWINPMEAGPHCEVSIVILI